MTPLSQALLGLVRMQPRSGYALRKVFETTPLGGYSSSPGSIYPALKALEKAGLLETKGPASHGKGIYHLTPDGERALDAWLAAPIGDLGEAMLRFAFLPDDDGQAIRAFLDDFEQTANAQADALGAFLAGDGAEGMTMKARLAVEHGRAGLQASAEWARRARTQFEDRDRGGTA
jgi:DNA-binding PadR family transcriptional regulator